MTFEEFEKWARRMEERHEALSQSLEILTHDVHELQGIAETALSSINGLVRIAESHERRITRLEDGE